MKEPLFNASLLKVKRANKHIRELQGVLNAFGKKGSYRTFSKPDPETGERIIGFAMTDKVSDDLSVIVGDVLHNLRSALDLTWYATLRMWRQPRDNQTRFPFFRRRKDLVGFVKGRKIQGLPTLLKTLIINVKPYKGRNNPLYTLHTLDITDKHKMLIQIHAAAGMTVKATGNEGPLYYVLFSREQSREESIIRVPANEEVEGYRHPMLHVSFPRIKVFKKQSIVPALLQLSRHVGDVIDAFEQTCLTCRK